MRNRELEFSAGRHLSDPRAAVLILPDLPWNQSVAGGALRFSL
jgi:hypothetical protein